MMEIIMFKAKYFQKVTPIFCVACFVLILLGCSQKKNEPLLIEPGVGIGKVEFGMSAKEVKKILGRPDVTTNNALAFKRFGLIIEIQQGTVRGITCRDAVGDNDPLSKACKARTGEGIGIGSTKEEVIAAYGEPTVSEPLRLGYKQLGAWFLLSDEYKVDTMLFNELR